MAFETEHRLWVVESNGSPRSGKGTITAALATTSLGAAQDETGADYRAATFGLLSEGLIEPDMAKDAVATALSEIDTEAASHYVARRYEIIAEHGNDVLYGPEVSGVVGLVSPHTIIRNAVKLGFSKRVKKHVDDPNTQILFVDGRNLSPVIEKIEGADLLLRMYVDCQPLVATQREAMRQGINVADPSNEEWFQETYDSIVARQKSDEARPTDPVKPDDNKIDYWFNNSLVQETVARLAKNLGIPHARAAQMLTSHTENFRKDGREGAGAKAFAEQRQVYYDTSETSKDSMIDFARRMVEEALEQSAGTYQPQYKELIQA